MLKKLARIEQSVSHGDQLGINKVKEYFQLLHAVLPALTEDQILSLKLAERAYKKIIMADGVVAELERDDEAAEIILSWYARVGNNHLESKLRMLFGTRIDFGLLNDNKDKPQIWSEAMDRLESDSPLRLLLSYYAKYKLALDIPTMSNVALFDLILNRGTVPEANKLKGSFLARIRNSSPEAIKMLVRTLSLLFLVDGQRVTDEAGVLSLTNAMQTVHGPDIVLPWISLVVLQHPKTVFPLGTIIWVCEMLNKYPVKGKIGEFSDISRLLSDSVAIYDLINVPDDFEEQCWFFARDQIVQVHFSSITVANNLFALAPACVQNEGGESEDRTSRHVDSSLGSPDLIQIKAQIAELKLQCGHLKPVSVHHESANKQTFVLDTNILLSYLRPLEQIIQHYPIKLVIPRLVISELEGLERGERLKREASEALDMILRSHQKGLVSMLDATGRLSQDAPFADANWPKDREVRTNDDAILFAVQRLSMATLVSDDINMRLKGQARQRRVLSWKEFIHMLSRSDD